MDSIIVEGLSVETIIGVHDWEKNQKQTVQIDLEVYLDTAAAADSDDLSQTISYGDLGRSVTSHVSEARFELIESLARSIADLVLAKFEPRRVVVRVSKPGAIANASNVALRIERP